MRCQIQGTAPTVYQLSSISRFGIPVQKMPGGAFHVCKSFETKREAIEHLYSAADRYCEDAKELMEARHDIKHTGLLKIDAAHCIIVTNPDDFQPETVNNY
jgi:hypothetical protein